MNVDSIIGYPSTVKLSRLGRARTITSTGAATTPLEAKPRNIGTFGHGCVRVRVCVVATFHDYKQSHGIWSLVLENKKFFVLLISSLRLISIIDANAI